LRKTFQERIGFCLTCHGENGQSDNVEVPSLGAEPAPFVLIQLYLFREKQRRVEPMTDAAKDLTDDDLRLYDALRGQSVLSTVSFPSLEKS
jgi:cytochrome c553